MAVSFAFDDHSLNCHSRRWKIGTDVFTLIAIEIPVADISPDDDLDGRWGRTV
jgi:hypothetical protein